MNTYFYPSVSEETFAAWLDGNLSVEDESLFLDACAGSKELQELLDAYSQVDESFEDMMENGYELPDDFKENFDLPKLISDSDDIEEYEYDDVEPYDSEDDDCEYSDNNEDAFNNHGPTEIGEDFEQNDYDIL